MNSGKRCSLAYRPDIDGLRALAVLSVVFYHANASWMPGGYVGVDVFFVISGFLITRLIVEEVRTRGSFRFGNFYLRRMRRLLPALLAIILLSMLGGYFLAPIDIYEDLGGAAVASLLSLSNIYFWQESGYFDASRYLKPLLHTWSLSLEEQFYLLWPLLLVFILRKKAALAPVALLAIVASSLYLSVTAEAHSAAAYYLLQYRAHELAIGALLVWTVGYRIQPLLSHLFFVAGIAMIVYAITSFSDHTRFPHYNALVPCLGTALVIQAGRPRLLAWLLENRLAVGVGLISYSLYLVHWPVIVLIRPLFFGLERWPPIEEILMVVALSIFLAVLLYRLVETPLRQMKTEGMLRGARFAVVGGMLMLVTSIPAAHIWLDGGWKWRYPHELQGLMSEVNLRLPLPAYHARCFIGRTGKSATERAESCYREATESGRPNVLLLGDSTAYHYADGLQALIGKQVNVFTWAVASCPPLRRYDKPGFPHCTPSMAPLFERVIDEQHYDLVIAAQMRVQPEMLEGFHETRAAFEERGARVILLGSSLKFKDSPRNLLARHGQAEGLDEYMATALSERGACDGREFGLETLVPPRHFFSVKGALCEGGRPIYEFGGGLTFVDTVHLSHRGSIFVVQQLVPWLVEQGHLDVDLTKMPPVLGRHYYAEAVLADLEELQSALYAYHEDHGRYPRTRGFSGLHWGTGENTENWIPGLVPGYISELPRDPRNHDNPKQQYIYRSNGRDFKLIAHSPALKAVLMERAPNMEDPRRPGRALGYWSEGGRMW